MDSISKRRSAAGDDLLKAWIDDALRLCGRRAAPRFIGFLDERQCASAANLIKHADSVNSLFYGGFPEAERQMLGIFPGSVQPDESVFPIEPLVFGYRKGVALTHRDFLGTILGCGVKREAIGDILCGDGLTVVFAQREIARFLETQISKVGGEGVTLIEDYRGELPAAHTFLEIRDTVASPRLDAVVRTAAGLSRESAAQRIESGLVSVNHTVRLSVSLPVRENDLISIRGIGRFKVQSIGPESRKGRLFLTLLKYV